MLNELTKTVSNPPMTIQFTGLMGSIVYFILTMTIAVSIIRILMLLFAFLTKGDRLPIAQLLITVGVFVLSVYILQDSTGFFMALADLVKLFKFSY